MSNPFDFDTNNKPAAIEASVDIRNFAGTLRQMYVALIGVGFTVDEALRIIGQTIAATGGSDK